MKPPGCRIRRAGHFHGVWIIRIQLPGQGVADIGKVIHGEHVRQSVVIEGLSVVGRQSGLVEEETSPDDARGRVYRLRREPFDALHGWLDEIEAFWTDQLGAFKAHAERTSKARPRRKPRLR